MEMTLRERVDAIMTHYNLSIAAFERTCNFSNGYIRQITNATGADKLAKILVAFPNIEPLWLIAGVGDMLKNSENSSSQLQTFANNNRSFNNFSNSVNSEISTLILELKKRDEQIDRMIKLLEYIVYQGGTNEFPTAVSLPESRQK